MNSVSDDSRSRHDWDAPIRVAPETFEQFDRHIDAQLTCLIETWSQFITRSSLRTSLKSDLRRTRSK